VKLIQELLPGARFSGKHVNRQPPAHWSRRVGYLILAVAAPTAVAVQLGLVR
jgi:hypothetical protein